VSLSHEFVGQERHDTLGAAIQPRRNPLTQWGNLGNSHGWVHGRRTNGGKTQLE
jgi:hypothetical protein